MVKKPNTSGNTTKYANVEVVPAMWETLGAPGKHTHNPHDADTSTTKRPRITNSVDEKGLAVNWNIASDSQRPDGTHDKLGRNDR